jgi:hypothetical protein
VKTVDRTDHAGTVRRLGCVGAPGSIRESHTSIAMLSGASTTEMN